MIQLDTFERDTRTAGDEYVLGPINRSLTMTALWTGAYLPDRQSGVETSNFYATCAGCGWHSPLAAIWDAAADANDHNEAEHAPAEVLLDGMLF
jgi:hypothetical protein